MRRTVALTLPIIVLAGAVMIFALLEARRTPDWRIELGQYIAENRLPGEMIKIQTIVEAGHPENFTQAMGQAVPNDWQWGTEALPSPPQAMYCVLLERSRRSTNGSPETPTHQLVFVGYHTDSLWRLGWLVHAGPRSPFTPEITAHLEQVGCELSLE